MGSYHGSDAGVTSVVRFLQKVWYSDGSVQVRTFEAMTPDAALSLAYEALDREIAQQWEQGRVTVVQALCDECSVVEAMS